MGNSQLKSHGKEGVSRIVKKNKRSTLERSDSVSVRYAWSYLNFPRFNGGCMNLR